MISTGLGDMHDQIYQFTHFFYQQHFYKQRQAETG